MDPPLTTLKTVFTSVIVALVQALLLFGSAGTLAWWNGWAFLSYNTVSGLAVSLGLYPKSPELAKERRTAAKKAKSWDKAVVLLQVIVFPVITLLLAGLDKRFGWTHSITTLASLLALLVMAGSSALIFWAMKSNRFFSSFVRIQEDRGHMVVEKGPYAYLRHPAYLGMILGGFAIPIQLGSWPAFGAGVANFLLVFFRTVLEDRMLREGLEGYRKYAQKVRYRLVPFLY
jgi:protein-S-isoprenylcysteine O-methyltransferase Ste14